MSEGFLSETRGTGHSRRRWGFPGFPVVLAVLVLAAGWFLLVLTGRVMPKQYESTAVIRVVGDPGVSGSGLEGPGMEDRMEMEALRVVGLPTFVRVRDRLNLEDRWESGGQEVMDQLRAMVRVTVRQGTDLIEITARHPDAKVARDVAMGVAEEYRDLRGEEMNDALQALEAELKAQEQKVEEKRRILDAERNKLGMNPPVPIRSAGWTAELKRRHDEFTDQIEQLQTRRGEELFRYAAGVMEDGNTAPLIYREYCQFRDDQLALQESGLAEAHPELVALAVRISDLEGDLKRSARALREGLQGRRESVREKLEGVADLEALPGNEEIRVLYLPSGQLRALRAYQDEQDHLRVLQVKAADYRAWVGSGPSFVAGGE